MGKAPENLPEIQKAVADRIAHLPPDVQAEIVPLIAYCFRAGYRDCQRVYAEAGAALRKGIDHGVSNQGRQA